MENEVSEDKQQKELIPIISRLIMVIAVLLLGIIIIPIVMYYGKQPKKAEKKSNKINVAFTESNQDTVVYWRALSINRATDAAIKSQLIYGKALIAHTAKYLGPDGSVQKMSNGLNCQNCHLEAGTAVFGNNYGSVASMYPKFRERSGTIENIYKRVNDCFERSLNGSSLDTNSMEMQAIVAYINYLGSNVPKGTKAAGSGLKELPFLDRAAQPNKGLIVYTAKCQSCHQQDGAGFYDDQLREYVFPPLWGKNSFNDGAGLNRISNFTKYVKYNMPQGATHLNTQLTDEEAWDVAAYVLAQPRPHMNITKDWPDKTKKPFDHPFGPYADSFSETQHRLGPFKPIVEAQQKMLGTLKTGLMARTKKST